MRILSFVFFVSILPSSVIAQIYTDKYDFNTKFFYTGELYRGIDSLELGEWYFYDSLDVLRCYVLKTPKRDFIRYYHENGLVKKEVFHYNGYKDKHEWQWNDKGILFDQKYFDKGVPCDIWISQNERGDTIDISNFTTYHLDGKYWSKEYFENGDLVYHGQFQNIEGIYSSKYLVKYNMVPHDNENSTIYFENGQKKSEGKYVCGYLKEGKWQYWLENGELEKEEEYDMGKMTRFKRYHNFELPDTSNHLYKNKINVTKNGFLSFELCKPFRGENEANETHWIGDVINDDKPDEIIISHKRYNSETRLIRTSVTNDNEVIQGFTLSTADYLFNNNIHVGIYLHDVVNLGYSIELKEKSTYSAKFKVPELGIILTINRDASLQHYNSIIDLETLYKQAFITEISMYGNCD